MQLEKKPSEILKAARALVEDKPALTAKCDEAISLAEEDERKPSSILRRARKIIEDPARWCRNKSMENADGHIANSLADAVKCCSLGALSAVASPPAELGGCLFTDVSFYLDKAAIELSNGRHGSIVGFNDSLSNKHEDVLRMFDKAIEAAALDEASKAVSGTETFARPAPSAEIVRALIVDVIRDLDDEFVGGISGSVAEEIRNCLNGEVAEFLRAAVNYSVIEQVRHVAFSRANFPRLQALLLEKNKAYGNSALDPVRIFASSDAGEQLRVRIDDKLSRIKRGHDFAGEDAIEDLRGYLVLLEVAKRAGVTA